MDKGVSARCQPVASSDKSTKMLPHYSSQVNLDRRLPDERLDIEHNLSGIGQGHNCLEEQWLFPFICRSMERRQKFPKGVRLSKIVEIKPAPKFTEDKYSGKVASPGAVQSADITSSLRRMLGRCEGIICRLRLGFLRFSWVALA